MTPRTHERQGLSAAFSSAALANSKGIGPMQASTTIAIPRCAMARLCGALLRELRRAMALRRIHDYRRDHGVRAGAPTGYRRLGHVTDARWRIGK
jgi:hypothetical protein